MKIVECEKDYEEIRNRMIDLVNVSREYLHECKNEHDLKVMKIYKDEIFDCYLLLSRTFNESHVNNDKDIKKILDSVSDIVGALMVRYVLVYNDINKIDEVRVKHNELEDQLYELIQYINKNDRNQSVFGY